MVQSLKRFWSNSVFRFFIWKCVKSRTIKKVLIPSREAKFIFCSWHLCHHHYNYYYHPFKIETLKWKWKSFFFSCFFLTPIGDVFVCLFTLSVQCVREFSVLRLYVCDIYWLFLCTCAYIYGIRMMVLYHCDR